MRSAACLLFLLITGQSHAERLANPKLDYWQNHPSGQMSAQSIIDYGFHSRGNIQLIIANNGTIGTFGSSMVDPFTGKLVTSCMYPRILTLFVSGLALSGLGRW